MHFFETILLKHEDTLKTIANRNHFPWIRISIAEIRSQDPALSIRLRNDPLRHLRALEAACHSLASEARPGYDKENVRVKVALAGPIGASASSPRSLTSSSLRQLVCVEGVATKVSDEATVGFQDESTLTDFSLGVCYQTKSGQICSLCACYKAASITRLCRCY